MKTTRITAAVLAAASLGAGASPAPAATPGPTGEAAKCAQYARQFLPRDWTVTCVERHGQASIGDERRKRFIGDLTLWDMGPAYIAHGAAGSNGPSIRKPTRAQIKACNAALNKTAPRGWKITCTAEQQWLTSTHDGKRTVTIGTGAWISNRIAARRLVAALIHEIQIQLASYTPVNKAACLAAVRAVLPPGWDVSGGFQIAHGGGGGGVNSRIFGHTQYEIASDGTGRMIVDLVRCYTDRAGTVAEAAAIGTRVPLPTV